MIKTDNTKGESLKEIKIRQRKEKEAELLAKCEAFAADKYGKDKLDEYRKKYDCIWFMSVMDEEDNIDALAIMRPVNRHILSFASTKITDDGMYGFLEQCMRECWLEGDMRILDEEEYFVPASQEFNKIIESKKVVFLKG